MKYPKEIIKEPFLLVILFIGLIWLRSGVNKLIDDNFINNLGNTLIRFNSNNPYPFVKTFLQNIAIPNSNMFGILTLAGELFAGICITLTILILIIKRRLKSIFLYLLIFSLLTGIVMNTVYWFSAGWTSPANDSLNLLMISIQLIGIFYLIFKRDSLI